MSRAFVFAIVWLLQSALILVFVSSGWIEKQISKERAAAEQYLGTQSAAYLKNRSDETFSSLFVETGIVQYTYDTYIPRRTQDRVTGMEDLAPWAFRWMRGRLDALWWWLYQAISRVHLVLYWAWYFIPFLAAALVDGMAVRRVRIYSAAYNNAVRFKAASGTLAFALFFPLLLITLPIAVPPVTIPLWMLLAGLVVMTWSSNLQHHL